MNNAKNKANLETEVNDDTGSKIKLIKSLRFQCVTPIYCRIDTIIDPVTLFFIITAVLK